MRTLNMLYISSLSLLLLAPGPAAALLVPEAAEIPYQINASNRIAIGAIREIDIHYDHTIVTVAVEEWLYNPLPAKNIKVKTETGKYVWTEDQAEFTLNEYVLLMLRDKDPDKQLFSVSVGFPGKHPVTDRDAVIGELKIQGKWQEENQKIDPGAANQLQTNSSSAPGPQSISFAGTLWTIAIVLGAVLYAGKEK